MRFLKYQPDPNKPPTYVNVAQIVTFKYSAETIETVIALVGEKQFARLPGDWTDRILGDAEVAE